MDAYIYQADLYCADCTKSIKARVAKEGNVPPNPDIEDSFDSDTYPKGPYADGGGESDSPSHCAGCGVFLENSLTTDGENYVRERIQEDANSRRTHNDTIRTWREFYSYLFA